MKQLVAALALTLVFGCVNNPRNDDSSDLTVEFSGYTSGYVNYDAHLYVYDHTDDQWNLISDTGATTENNYWWGLTGYKFSDTVTIDPEDVDCHEAGDTPYLTFRAKQELVSTEYEIYSFEDGLSWSDCWYDEALGDENWPDFRDECTRGQGQDIHVDVDDTSYPDCTCEAWDNPNDDDCFVACGVTYKMTSQTAPHIQCEDNFNGTYFYEGIDDEMCDGAGAPLRCFAYVPHHHREDSSGSHPPGYIYNPHRRPQL